jgi:hypothetical protein
MSDARIESIAYNIDEFRPAREVGNVDGYPIVLPGDRVFVRGWALSREGATITTELSVGGRSVPLPRTVHRLDVTRDRTLPACGFELLVDIDPPVTGNTVPIALHVRLGDAHRTIRPERRVVVARDLEPATDELPATLTRYGRFRAVVDADPRDPRHGWGGRRTMRWGSAIAIRGWLLDSRRRPPARVWLSISGHGTTYRVEAALVGDGEATAAAGGEAWFLAGFTCVISPWSLAPGLHFITATLVDQDGALECGPTEAFQVVDDDEWEPPLFLPIGAARTGTGDAEVGPVDVVRGTPVVLRGSSADPATGRGGAVYVRFGTNRALPVPAVPGEPARFAGIADTGVLQPGTHRLQVLLQPAYPGFWHLIAERDVTVRRRPLGIAADGEEVVVNG